MLRMKLYGSPESQIKNVLYCRNASLAKGTPCVMSLS